jgi:hypothetical protein
LITIDAILATGSPYPGAIDEVAFYGVRRVSSNQLEVNVCVRQILWISPDFERANHRGAEEKARAEILLLKDNPLDRCRGTGLRMDEVSRQ